MTCTQDLTAACDVDHINLPVIVPIKDRLPSS